MAKVIGKNRMNLKKIEAKTKATLKVFERNSLYIKGSPESQKLAIRAIKETVVSLSVIRKYSVGIFLGGYHQGIEYQSPVTPKILSSRKQ